MIENHNDIEVLCIRANYERGIVLRAEKTENWLELKKFKSIFSVTRYGKIQYWFTKEHTRDFGATS